MYIPKEVVRMIQESELQLQAQHVYRKYCVIKSERMIGIVSYSITMSCDQKYVYKISL